MTAEDPVEFNLVGVNQVQMKEQIGLNFAPPCAHSCVRIRTSSWWVRFATSRPQRSQSRLRLPVTLVLSTLHTNDAPSSINRLMNMGIEPFLVASSVNLIAAQRLVRKICTTCKEPIEVPEQALIDVGFSKTDIKALKLFRGKGCERCGGTGFKGRIALFEVMDVDEEIRELILSGGSANELRQQSLGNGMLSLRASGLQKIRQGMTTLEEVHPGNGRLRSDQALLSHRTSGTPFCRFS